MLLQIIIQHLTQYTFNTTLGIKGYHAEIDMLYHEPTGNGKK
jgi:hypothetical protein